MKKFLIGLGVVTAVVAGVITTLVLTTDILDEFDGEDYDY